MAEPRVNVHGIVRYTNASIADRARRAASLVQESNSDYNPGTDFWKRMRDAIYRDRKTTRDGSALELAVQNAIARRRPSFSAIANEWPEIAQRWATCSFRTPGRSIVNLGGLEVVVKPLFTEVWPDGRVENVLVWMNEEEPTDVAVRAALRLLLRGEPTRDSIASFVDARRGHIWSASGDDLAELDDFLDVLGADLLLSWAA